MQRLFGINLKNTDDRNIAFLCLEVFFAAFLAAAINFNSAFAVRLGANNVEIGLLSSLPALLAVLSAIPVGNYVRQHANRKPWVVIPLLIFRFGYLLVAFSPLFKTLGIAPGTAVVIIIILNALPAHIFNVSFLPMLAEIVPENRRAATFSARNVISSATVTFLIFICGLWLNYASFPMNYQVMYFIGFLFSVLSVGCLQLLHVPPSLVIETQRPKSLGEQIRGVRDNLVQEPGFVRFTLNTLMHGMGLWAATPLYTLYFVRELNASDGWLGVQGSLANLLPIAGYIVWRRFIHRYGEPRILQSVCILLGVYPLLVGLLPNLNLILIAVALNGIIAPGMNLSHFNTQLKLTPEEKRPEYTAIYMTIVNMGVFLAPLLGVAIADRIGLAPTLIGAGLLSIAGSFSFWIWPPKPKHVSA